MENQIILSDAVENLYRAFAHCALRKHMEGCPCCVDEPETQTLAGKMLRLLSAADLGRYAFKAMTTWGGKDDFRHFLPRIFELLTSNDGIGYDEEVILGKLALAEWKQWPQQEQAALRDFFQAVWKSLLFHGVPHIKPDSWICGLGRAGEDVTPYLNHWLNSRSKNAYERLVEFIGWNQHAFAKRRHLTNDFWTEAPQAIAQVCAWLQNPQTRTALEKIYFENSAADFTPALAAAIERLEALAKN